MIDRDRGKWAMLGPYADALQRAWDDGRVTRDEFALLSRLGEALLRDVDPYTLYREVLEQALADEIITGDESAILEALRHHYRLTEDQAYDILDHLSHERDRSRAASADE